MKSATAKRTAASMAKINLTPALCLRKHSGRIDEVVLHALAFSTLLSSQETDAHPQARSRGPSGATLKLYYPVSFVSTWCFRSVSGVFPTITGSQDFFTQCT